MTFALWGTEVGRDLGHFNDERDAMSLVLMQLVHLGADNAADLGRAADDGEILQSLSDDAATVRISEVLPEIQSVESGARTVIVPSG